MADVDSLVIYGTAIVLAVLLAVVFLAKRLSDDLEKKLSEVRARVDKLGNLVDRLDVERKSTVEASRKKVGRAAFEKIFSEAIDFITAMLSRNRG